MGSIPNSSLTFTMTKKEMQDMTVPELTQEYNSRVSKDKRIKKFSTKGKAIERLSKLIKSGSKAPAAKSSGEKRHRKTSDVLVDYKAKVDEKQELKRTLKETHEAIKGGATFDDLVDSCTSSGTREPKDIVMMRLWQLSKKGYNVYAKDAESKIKLS